MSEERIYKVYMHTNILNGKKYIGITSSIPEKRWANGKGYKKNTHFRNAIDKYGWDNFKHEILFTDLLEDEAYKKERELISKHDTINPNKGYNKTTGGEKCKKYTLEIKEKISKNHADVSGINNPSYNKGKMIVCMETGKVFDTIRSAEKELNISNIQAVVAGNQYSAGGLHFCYIDDYECDKQYNLDLKYKPIRKVICIETKDIYNSINECEKQLNINGVSKNCHGKTNSAGGLHFVFLDEYDENKKYDMRTGSDIRKKPIICVNNNRVYNSISEAGSELKLSNGNIVAVLKGRIKNTKGYIFQYLDKKGD